MAVADWSNWQAREKAVLVFLSDETNLLLIHKKRGLGKGKVNAPGGRVEPGESWEQAGLRETREETGLTVSSLEAAAELRFQFTDGYSLDVRVFLASGWTGVLTPCDEADPFWHSSLSLPWGSMWADDAVWLPLVLAGHSVQGQFVFDKEEMREASLRSWKRPPRPMDG